MIRRPPLVALLLLFQALGEAQPADTASVPRTPWGRPVLQGVWTNSTLTPVERPEEYGDRECHTPEEVAELQRGAVQGRVVAQRASRAAALRAHRTQSVPINRCFFSKPDVHRILGIELFRQALGPPLRRVPEDDVLAGIDLTT